MRSHWAKIVVVAGTLMAAPLASGSALHEIENQRTSCNQKGYFYDASGAECTASKLTKQCDSSSLQRMVAARGGSSGDWASTHQKLSQKGYKIAQCSLDADTIRVGYVKPGIVIRYQTVTFQ